MGLVIILVFAGAFEVAHDGYGSLEVSVSELESSFALIFPGLRESFFERCRIVCPLCFLSCFQECEAIAFGFLVALPLGVGFARYLRTFYPKWLLGHMLVNFIISGPLIFAGFALGVQTTTMSGLPHFHDPHQVRPFRSLDCRSALADDRDL